MTKSLYIWVEGPDDRRFFERIICPQLGNAYDSVRIVTYADKSKKWRGNFMKSIAAMKADYLYVADINRTPCVSARKAALGRSLTELGEDRCIIAVTEIESWYLAGLDEQGCAAVGIKPVRNTDSISKERFDAVMPKRFDSRIDFMSEVLNRFRTDIAKTKNKSFAYLAARCGL